MLKVIRITEVVVVGDHLCFFFEQYPPQNYWRGGGEQYKRDGGPGQAGEAEGLLLGIVGQGGRLICVEPCDWWELFGGYSEGGFSGDGKCFNHSQVIMHCNESAAKSF